MNTNQEKIIEKLTEMFEATKAEALKNKNCQFAGIIIFANETETRSTGISTATVSPKIFHEKIMPSFTCEIIQLESDLSEAYKKLQLQN